MAYTSGTCTDYKNLLSILASFAGANGWTVLEQTTTRVYLKGTGTAGLDEIYVGINAYENSSTGYYNWEVVGSIGWRTGRAWPVQPGVSGANTCFLYLWNAPMAYWIVATPRRIILVAKVSTSYQTLHLGLLTQVATEAQYPYPLLIGGSGNTSAQAYSVTTDYNSAFWSTPYRASGMLHLPSGEWSELSTLANTRRQCNSGSVNSSLMSNVLAGLDGTVLLEKVYVYDNSSSGPSPAVYGFVEGLFRVSGYGNSAENITTIAGVHYLSVPNIFRSGTGDYCALRLN